MRLIIEDLEGSTTVVNLGTEDVTIGRKPHNTIQLTEQNVSRSHAKLVFQEDGWLIEDLGSYNGVKVNGVPIQGPTLLRESDLIQIGDYHLTLTDDVDRATVDIGPRAAANDSMVTGAVTGMASGELPSVSVEDLPPMRGPSIVAPGGAPAHAPGPAAQGEDKNNKTGLILGIVGAIVALAGLGIWAATRGGDDKPDAEVAEPPTQQAKADPPAVVPDPPADTAAPAEDDGGPIIEDNVAEDDGGPIIEDNVAEADDGELIEDDGAAPTDEGEPETEGGDEPEPETEPKPKPKPKPRPKPATPKLPPDEALAQARKASLTGNNKKAYSLAKDAYDQNKSSDALNLMGVSACKMGSKSKAKSAYRKMSSAKDKQMLEKLCTPLGIELQ